MLKEEKCLYLEQKTLMYLSLIQPLMKASLKKHSTHNYFSIVKEWELMPKRLFVSDICVLSISQNALSLK